MDTFVLEELIDGVSDVLEDKIVGEVEKTRFGEALICKFDNTAIMYDEDKL